MPAIASPAQNGVSASTNGVAQPVDSASTLADVLVSQGLLKKEQAEAIKLQELQEGKTQEEIIQALGTVNEEQLARAKASFYNIPFLDLNQAPISPEALAVLPQSVAARFSVLPISVNREKNTLDLAMANPLDLSANEFVEQKTNLRVNPLAVVPSLLAKILTERYSIGLAEEVTSALKETDIGEKTIDLSKLSEIISEAPIARIVKELLAFAVKARASDIHIEPEEKQTRVRYRIDGILQEKFTMPRQFHDALISRIKILGGMKIDEKRIPQDGRFSFKSGLEEVDLRVSSLPIVYGEKIVMRLLKKTGGVPDLPDLGLRGRALKNLQDAILRPHGIILVTGPTGSGKTTTLYSVLSKINTPKVNILTLEDPVEYKMAGVNQVQINADAGLTFATGLRSFLRQDPNIIMVGEIRDQETAQLAIQASLTGHLVFATLHTNSAAGALPRLVDMGAEPFLIASTITCILAQRVCRKIHEPCREDYTPEAPVVEDMKKTLGNLWSAKDPVKLYKGKGDQEDGNTGYMGRVGIYEVMPITEKIGRLAIARESAESIQKQAEEEGMITMKQDGYLKALDGITTIEEVLRVAQE
ncbi:MAG: putative type II secretion system protein E [Microgenomates group bacterium Gr01-1014_5]|nr:MAG: putative type II secretion system protein E [Microgenomates group bacterium Gr01-1014_5]